MGKVKGSEYFLNAQYVRQSSPCSYLDLGWRRIGYTYLPPRRSTLSFSIFTKHSFGKIPVAQSTLLRSVDSQYLGVP